MPALLTRMSTCAERLARGFRQSLHRRVGRLRHTGPPRRCLPTRATAAATASISAVAARARPPRSPPGAPAPAPTAAPMPRPPPVTTAPRPRSCIPDTLEAGRAGVKKAGRGPEQTRATLLDRSQAAGFGAGHPRAPVAAIHSVSTATKRSGSSKNGWWPLRANSSTRAVGNCGGARCQRLDGTV